MIKHNLPNRDLVMGGNYSGGPIAHYPNWAFNCPNCGYYELPQNLPDIKEAYQNQTLLFMRPCGCKEGNRSPYALSLSEVL